MKRLTEKDDLGNWCLKGVRWEQLRAGQVITKEVSERLYGALCKLRDYEDTGCIPDDVERLNDFTQNEAVKLVQKLNAEEKKHRWIPVEERLPEEASWCEQYNCEVRSMVKDIKAYHQSNTEAGLEVSNEAMAHFLVYVEHEHIGNTHFVKSCAVDEVRLLLIAAGINKELNDVE